MLEITPDDIAALKDDDLRLLVGRLCAAELSQRGLAQSALTYGGDQDAPDGGIDVHIDLPPETARGDFLPRAKIGLQVKKSDILPSNVSPEMRPRGIIRPAIQHLADHAGAYIIVSSGTDATYTALIDRRQAMADALEGVANADALHVDFYDRSRVAMWLRNHQALIPWVRQIIGRSIQGWRSYDAWAYSPEGLEDEYLNDDKLRIHGVHRHGEGASMADGIKRLRAALSSPRGVVRLLGLSGVGKTRLVQALFDRRVGEESLDPALVIYTDMGNSPDPHPSHMADNLVARNARTILIVDNCPSDLHRRLADICRRRGSALSLLTVEYDIQADQPEGTDVFRLEPSSDDFIQKLIRRRYGDISAVDAAAIARSSGGNARGALVVAGTVGRNETVASLSDEDLLKRLFYQGNAPDDRLMRAAQACALVYSFDGQTFDGDSAELPKLADLADMTVGELFGYLSILKGRDLVQQRSVWRALLPQTIANNIAKLALLMFPIHKIEGAMNTERLQKSFARRLGYLHDSKEACEVVSRWLEPGGLLANLNKHDELKWEIFEHIAPVVPEATLTCLENLIGAESAAIPLDPWRYDRAGRLLRSIAFEAVFFERSVNLLLVLAEAEWRRGRQSLGSVNSILQTLFQIRYSGSHAPVEMRVQIVDRLLRSDNSVYREIGANALQELLRTRDFQANHSFGFGARTRDFGYWPTSGEDVTNWFQSALKMLMPLACSDHPAASQVRSVFARSFRGVWSIGFNHDELERIARGISSCRWQEGWIAIRKALRKDGPRMPVEDRARLAALELLLRPEDLVNRTRAVVLTQAWGPLDYADVAESEIENVEQNMERYRRAAKTAEELGASVAGDDNSFQVLLPELVCGDGSRLRAFGIGLATPAGDRTARWNALVEAAQKPPEGRRNFGALEGFIEGVYRVEPALCDGFLDALTDDPVLGPWLPVLQTCVPINAAGVARLRLLLEADIAPVENFRHMAGGCYLDEMDAGELRLLIDAVRQKPRGFVVACDILSMRLHTAKGKEHDNPQLIEAARALLQGIVFENADNMQSYRLTEFAKFSLGGEAGAATVEAACKQLISAMSKGEIYRFDGEKFIPALFEAQPVAALDALLGGDLVAAKYGCQIIHNITVNHDNPLDAVPDETLITWCDKDAALRYPMMSSVVSFSRGTDSGDQGWTSLALQMLERAPDAMVVLSSFADRFSPVMCEGSRAVYMAQRARLLDDLDSRFGDEIMAFAQARRIELQNEIDHHREWEAKRDRSRDESFE
jgi:hypothetical protein